MNELRKMNDTCWPSDMENKGISAIGTILIAQKNDAADIVNNHVESDEVGSILAVKFKQLRNPKKLVSKEKILQAKCIYPNSSVKPSYLLNHILTHRSDICKTLDKICELPDDYYLICEVEYPKVNEPMYKDINIGVSSHGIIKDNESFVECSIRETNEETQLSLPKSLYNYGRQMQYRKDMKVDELPLYFKFKTTFCFILILRC